ncbi:MAG: hypothetical protein ACLFPA_11325 [Dichotomicrobium sp.]
MQAQRDTITRTARVALLCLLLPALVFALAGCAGARVYMDVSATAFDQPGARPEVTLDSPMAGYAVGVEYEGWYFEPITHYSGLLAQERGYGITGYTLGKRWSFAVRRSGTVEDVEVRDYGYDEPRSGGCGP